MNFPMVDNSLKKPINDVYIFGEVLFDCFPNEEVVLGGAPLNVARHLKGFGLNPKLVSAVGNDDLGQKLLTSLDAWGLATDHIGISQYKPTGQVKIEIINGDAKYAIKNEVAYDYIDAPTISASGNQAILYHGSLALRNQHSRQSLTQISQARDFIRFIDVNLRAPWWTIDMILPKINCAECVKLNQDELEILAQAMDITHGNWLELAKEFRVRNNIVNLLITRGSEGAGVIGISGEITSIEPRTQASEVVDTVGAGDAFASICLLGLAHRWDWSVSLVRAQEFATLIVQQRGATLKDRAVYDDFSRLWGL